MVSRSKFAAMVTALLAAVWIAGSLARADEPAAPAAPSASNTPAAGKSLPNPTVNASVTEWVIFVADVSKPELNARSLFLDSLPPMVEDLRMARPVEKANPGEPGPVGVIRFVPDGTLDGDAAVDVQLSYKGGRALGHWPRAKVRSSGLLWQGLRLVPKKAELRPLQLSGGVVGQAAAVAIG